LQPGKQYSWHVRSKSGTLYSDWSNAESFNTIATAGPVIPIASWPVGYATVYTTSPSLYWYLGSSSAGLTFEVEYVEGLATSFSGSPNILNITSLSTTLSNLIPGRDYKWHVRSTDGSSTSDWSAAESFSVISSVANNPVVPIPSWPVGGATVYSNTVQLNWYLGTYATGLIYDVELRTGTLNGTPTTAGITNLNTTVSNLSPATTYFWRVRSSNGSLTSDWSATESFQTISSAVTATVPILSWPIGGATVYTNAPSLSWYLNSPSGGITYELQYGTSSNMIGALTIGGLTSNQINLNGLTAGSIYYWRVRSFDGTVYSSYSGTESFVTFAGNSASVVPVAASPSKGISIESSSAMLSWFLPTQGDVVNYELQYSKNSEMQEAANLKLNSTSQIVSGLESGKTYYWRVRSVNTDGEVSSYSALEMFTPNSTTGITDKKEIPTTFELKQNYPNPFNPTTIMEFNIPVKGFYTLNVFNILGEKVSTLVNGMLDPGIYKSTFKGNNLSSGVYLYRLYGNNVNLVRKMLLIK
jgi:predicted phage tail protein